MLTPIKQNVIPIIRISVFLLELYYKNCTQLLVYFKFVKNFVEIWFLSLFKYLYNILDIFSWLQSLVYILSGYLQKKFADPFSKLL